MSVSVLHHTGRVPPDQTTSNRRHIASAAHTRRPPECVVIRVDGEVDATACPELQQALAHAVQNNPRSAVVVDFSAVSFLSIRAATMLRLVARQAGPSGITIRLVADTPEVERALELTGVRSVFDCYTSLRSALAS